ncbi:AIPR family protein [Skermanella stibiiresistens]|uniref:AIPR family protein n=1 Tax=Skermanella stibiiresistens TaxID=913326 RepID=UPI0004B57D99|nr:AIPR family protein [Skermanella stibiiresistens]
MKAYPSFLSSFDDFDAHICEYFSKLSNVEKGSRFAKFAANLIPFVDELREFGEVRVSPKKSHDGGIDVESDLLDDGRRLCAQSKLSITTKEEIDTIISKFEAYEINLSKPPSQGQLFAGDQKKPHSTFVIIVSARIDGIMRRYLQCSMSSRKFYDKLVKSGRIFIIDGPRIHQILQTAYGKTFSLPSQICLSSTNQWIQCGSVWLGYLPAQELIDIYKKHGDALFFENIRDYLGRTSGKVAPDQPTVNEDISETIKNQPTKFLERNNGITFKAGEVKPQNDRELILKEASIVNGCQTTMSLVEAKDSIGECVVQVKIIESSDAWDVAKSANYQNTVDKIELDLAKFLRPQLVRMYASGAGVDLEDAQATTAIALLGGFYDGKIRYEEIRYLYIGIMSNSPNNVGDQLYTKLRSDLICGFADNLADQKLLMQTLFKTVTATRRAVERCEDLFGQEEYMNPFLRVFHDRKPKYRIFLAILSLCAHLRIDISARSDDPSKEFERMRCFVQGAQDLLDQNETGFIRTYARALNQFANEARSNTGGDDAKIKQYLSNLLKRGFKSLYSTLIMSIDTESRLHQI